MKKIMLTTAAIAALSAQSAMAAEDMFYLKLDAGWAGMNKLPDDGSFPTKASNSSFYLGLGAGYYLMDNVRADLTLTHHINQEMKYKGSEANGKVSLDANSLLVNSYVDVVDLGMFKLFAGAGVGFSYIGGKIEAKASDALTKTIAAGNVAVDGETAEAATARATAAAKATALSNNFDALNGAKAKRKMGFAYAAHLGASAEVAPGVNLEGKYSWMDFGKTGKFKKTADGKTTEFGDANSKGHHLSFGVRFDL